ncbi:hypothetical protein BWP24_27320 (plasmid) [Vibrio campbellii]|nr:hypothetical protein BWP24_27320 [Vibrio campbellii]
MTTEPKRRYGIGGGHIIIEHGQLLKSRPVPDGARKLIGNGIYETLTTRKRHEAYRSNHNG